MSCECQQSNALDFAGLQQLATDNNALYFFIQGVRVGQSIKAAEQQKWTRLGVILALTFGTLTFMKHLGNDV